LIEATHSLKTHELDQILSAASSLLLDFFNYSVPGIRQLSLHALSLVDGDMALLAKGLAVNTSLTHLSLSLNLIEEDGFQVIFSALASSPKSSLVSLDLSWNLVRLTDGIIRQFDGYRRGSSSLPATRQPLTINLLHNRITSPSQLRRDDDLIVRVVEDPRGGDDEEGDMGEGGRGDPSKIRRRHAQAKSDTAPGRSKFKSSLLRDLRSPLASKTMRM
jgi:hypothetical protein